jgi:hypothetical protein
MAGLERTEGNSVMTITGEWQSVGSALEGTTNGYANTRSRSRDTSPIVVSGDGGE